MLLAIASNAAARRSRNARRASVNGPAIWAWTRATGCWFSGFMSA